MAGIKRCHDGNEKRKHITLTIEKKVEIIQKLDSGSSVNYVAGSFGISPRTVYDIRKNREKLLNFYANSDSNVGIAERKTMRTAKSQDLDAVLYEWFRQRRSEGVPITGPLLCEKAKDFHKELKVEEQYNFSSGWLTRFKQRHGIKYLKACGEKLSADNQGAEDFIEEFSNLVNEESLSPEQIYNMDETGLFWRCLPRRTLATSDESGPSGVKEAKERVTVVVCSNAAGTHKCKLLLIAKSKNPRALKGIKTLPVLYKSNKKAWITRDLTTDWFENYFVKEARMHCTKVGLSENCKIILLLDNCAAHPELQMKDNVSVLFLPPNTTSLIQPMDQGIIHSIKCHYRTGFLRHLIYKNPSVDMIEEYKKNFNLKDSIFMLAEAWNSISQDTLVHAWRNLWPESLFIETEKDNVPFEGFYLSEAKEKTAELLAFAQNQLTDVTNIFKEVELLNWMTMEDEVPVTEIVTDDEIISSVVQTAVEHHASSSDTESDTEEEKMSFEQALNFGDRYLNFLQKQSFVTEQEIMTVHRLQEKILKNKAKILKQTTIESMFQKFKDKQ